MPQYKLTYFDIRARAEVSRMIFAAAGVQYEDRRLGFSGNEWPELKPKTPFGQMPILEVDGNMYAQSNAINRYLSKEFGFYGINNEEQLRVDMVVESIDDLLDKLILAMSAETDEQKAAIKKKWLEKQAPEILQKLEDYLKTNNGGNGWFVGDKMSFADLHFQNWMDFPSFQMKLDFDLSKYPKLDALKKRVERNERIAAWFAKRPSP